MKKTKERIRRRLLSMVMALMMTLSVVSYYGMSESSEKGRVEAAVDRSRPNADIEAPASDNPYYFSTLNPFYPKYKMPNCTCYAWGRAYELLGHRPSLSTGNAVTFWTYNENYGYYPSGQEPTLGAIAVWGGGSSGWGHVAVVEAIYGDAITISESGYTGGIMFRKRTIYRSSNYYYGSSYNFKGFIYILGINSETGSSLVNSNNPGSPYPIPSRIIRYLNTGDDVRWVQNFLMM